VDDGFARALKAGRVIMKPGIDRFDGPEARGANVNSAIHPAFPGRGLLCAPALA